MRKRYIIPLLFVIYPPVGALCLYEAYTKREILWPSGPWGWPLFLGIPVWILGIAWGIQISILPW
jgi:hypothetical protein